MLVELKFVLGVDRNAVIIAELDNRQWVLLDVAEMEGGNRRW